MKIYFHQYIVEVLSNFFPILFDRYFQDYTVAIVHKARRERKTNDNCPRCGGEYQQIDKEFTPEGYKILIDSCKNCGYIRER